MRTAVIIQARMTSTRLPGKVLAEVNGRPLLEVQAARLRASCRMVDEVVIATTTNAADDPVAAVGRRLDIPVFRGSEDDVLSRYIGAARLVETDLVVRSTADCPLIAPATVDLVVARYLHGDTDHVEMRGIPDGMGCEAVSRRLLEQIATEPDLTDEDREHVTLYIRRRPDRFRKARVDLGLGMDRVRWTVDTADDLALIRRIFAGLGTVRFTFEDVRRLVAAHPEWTALNEHVPMGPLDVELVGMVDREEWGHAPWLGDL